MADLDMIEQRQDATPADTGSNASVHEGPQLLRLADELLLQIIKDVDVAATIALRQTCKRLHYITPTLREQPLWKVSFYLLDREVKPFNRHKYACFACFTLQPGSNFLRKKTRGSFNKNSPNATQRTCLTCQAPTIVPGNHFAIDGGKMMKCWYCEQITVEFCRRCSWCLTCAERHLQQGLGPVTKVLNVKPDRQMQNATRTVTSYACANGTHVVNDAPTQTILRPAYLRMARNATNDEDPEDAKDPQSVNVVLAAWKASCAFERTREIAHSRTLEHLRHRHASTAKPVSLSATIGRSRTLHESVSST